MPSPDSRLRILDASLNRAAEGLRVAEDVARFHFGFRGLAKELKEIRHELLRTGRGDAGRTGALLRSRDVAGDVGRATGVSGPIGRAPVTGDEEAKLSAIALTNVVRAREALRTLEELTRDDFPEAARAFEALRYRLYAIERGMTILSERRPRRDALATRRLYLLLTASLARLPWKEALVRAIDGGVDVVQLREKQLSDRELLDRAREIREITARHDALFFVNDRADIAKLAGADGVHLGQDDLSPAEARALADESLLIGQSTHSLEQVRGALHAGVDLIGIGPCYPTPTKDAGPPLSREERRAMLESADVPAFVIGGVSAESIAELAAEGARRAAVSSAVLRSERPDEAARRIREALDRSAPLEASDD